MTAYDASPGQSDRGQVFLQSLPRIRGRLAERLAARAAADERLELFAPPVTGVVLWRGRGLDARQLRARLRGAVVALAEVDAEWWLRSVPANPLADVDLVVDCVLAAAEQADGTV